MQPRRLSRPLASLSALLLAALATACWTPQVYRPGPLQLERPARAIPLEACEPTAEPRAPGGHAAPPTADGELALLDVRGDDRLAITGSFVATWSSDGERLVTATEDSVLVWTVRTGELERRLDLGATPAELRNVVISPDGAWIAVSGQITGSEGSSELCTWLLRANGAAPAKRFAGVGSQLRFTPDSLRLLARGHVWSLATGTLATTPTLKEEALLLPDGLSRLVFARTSPAPRSRVVPELRDVATGVRIHRFPEVESSVHVALSGDGRRLAILDDALSIYSMSTFERVAQIRDVERASLVNLSHDGSRAVIETLTCADFLSDTHQASDALCAPPVLAVWDLDRSQRILRTDQDAGREWAFTRDGAYLTRADPRFISEIIRVKDGATLRFGSRIHTISPDSRWILFEGQLGPDIASLDGSATPPAVSRTPRVLARSADGHLVANLDSEGRLRIEGPGSCVRLGLKASKWPEKESPYDHLDLGVDQVIFSPDGASLFTVTRSTMDNDLFRAFRTSDGVERWSIRGAGSSGDGAGVHLLPSAGQVIFQGQESFDLLRFDATTGAALRPGRAPGISNPPTFLGVGSHDVRDLDGDRASTLVSPASTRDGRSLATYDVLKDEPRFSIWDPLEPRRVVDFPIADRPSQLALSPDERLWAAGLVNGKISIFSREGRPIVDAAPAHESRITAMVFTKSGDRLATAADDGAVLLVSTANGAVVGRAHLPLDHATHLWASPDGHELWADTARAMRVRFRLAR